MEAFGAPGCLLYFDIAGVYPLIGFGGTATWDLPIPNLPTIVGLGFWQQGIFTDPQANPLGLTVSNAGRGTFGQR